MTHPWLREATHGGRMHRHQGTLVVRYDWPSGAVGLIRLEHAERVLDARTWWNQTEEEKQSA